MASRPAIPKGTRDFSPEEISRRNYIFDTIKSVYRSYGFQPIETPSMEYLSTLMGKYGEEGDKLLFKILNSGDFLADAGPDVLTSHDAGHVAALLCEKGLRYDLTVPFARYVVQHRAELVFPFKRYQIQPVWRADRPQKGRYREFYQCDADVVGSDSLLYDAELVQMVDQVFRRLQISVTVKLNNRKILSGIAELLGQAEKVTDLTTAIDKLDKIGLENVNAELLERGFSAASVARLQPVLQLSGSTEEKLSAIAALFEGTSETGLKGVAEMREVLGYVTDMQVQTAVEFDLTLARGLNYYTGTIIEVKANDVKIGSICGGGRYDNLTGIFGMPGLSGVGISFGADRIYDVLLQTDGFPDSTTETTQVLFVNFGGDEMRAVLPLLSEVRRAGISAEIYPDSLKMKKQLAYADSRHIAFVAILGGDEMASGSITVKELATGQQTKVAQRDLVDFLLNR
ncbi:MAG: histidine--tRNA ligase [Bacteroidales bacterium]|nr:histidine--tRNA ligase [Bacteroidales bacterium]